MGRKNKEAENGNTQGKVRSLKIVLEEQYLTKLYFVQSLVLTQIFIFTANEYQFQITVFGLLDF